MTTKNTSLFLCMISTSSLRSTALLLMLFCSTFFFCQAVVAASEQGMANTVVFVDPSTVLQAEGFEDFLQVTMDIGTLTDDSFCNFSDPKFIRLTTALNFSSIRIGGTEGDYTYYGGFQQKQQHRKLLREKKEEKEQQRNHIFEKIENKEGLAATGTDAKVNPPAPFTRLLTPAIWNSFATFAKNCKLQVLFGLNAGPFLRSNNTGDWNSRNAETFIRYNEVYHPGVMKGYEFGNEPNLYLIHFYMSLQSSIPSSLKVENVFSTTGGKGRENAKPNERAEEEKKRKRQNFLSLFLLNKKKKDVVMSSSSNSNILSPFWINGSQWSKDMHQLRLLLNQINPSLLTLCCDVIYVPAFGEIGTFMKEFVKAGGLGAINVTTWHFYPTFAKGMDQYLPKDLDPWYATPTLLASPWVLDQVGYWANRLNEDILPLPTNDKKNKKLTLQQKTSLGENNGLKKSTTTAEVEVVMEKKEAQKKRNEEGQKKEEPHRRQEDVHNTKTKVPTTIDIWLGETGSASFGGQQNVSNRFVDALQYLDKTGQLGRAGHRKMFRQELCSKGGLFHEGNSHYTLIAQDMVPRPTYYMALLIKKLIGAKVYSSQSSSNGLLRAYAYSNRMRSNVSGGVTTLINLNNESVSPTVCLKMSSLDKKTDDDDDDDDDVLRFSSIQLSLYELTGLSNHLGRKRKANSLTREGKEEEEEEEGDSSVALTSREIYCNGVRMSVSQEGTPALCVVVKNVSWVEVPPPSPGGFRCYQFKDRVMPAYSAWFVETLHNS